MSSPVFMVIEKTVSQGGSIGPHAPYRQAAVRFAAVAGIDGNGRQLLSDAADFAVVFKDADTDQAERFVIGARYELRLVEPEPLLDTEPVTSDRP